MYTYSVYDVHMTATNRRIIIASRRLLDKEGAEAVTMRRVAKAVGITPMAIYRHYADRTALLNALADEGFEELAAQLARERAALRPQTPAPESRRLLSVPRAAYAER